MIMDNTPVIEEESAEETTAEVTSMTSTVPPPRRTSSLYPRISASDALKRRTTLGKNWKIFGNSNSSTTTTAAPIQALTSTAGSVLGGLVETPITAADTTLLDAETVAKLVLAEKRRRHVEVRKYILTELLNTEVNYVSHLDSLLQIFRSPLTKAAMGDKYLCGQPKQLTAQSKVSLAASSTAEDGADVATIGSSVSIATTEEPPDTSSYMHRAMSRKGARWNHEDHSPAKESQSLPTAPTQTLSTAMSMGSYTHHSKSTFTGNALGAIIPMVDIKIIFSWIEELFQNNQIFCAELQTVVDQWQHSESIWAKLDETDTEPLAGETLEDALSIGQLFLSHSQGWKVYLKFVDNYSAAMEAIRRSDENPRFVEFAEECLKNRDTNGQKLGDYLILPVQRVTRYALLLQDLKKHTPVDHLEYPNIIKALEVMKQLADTVNEVKRREEEMTRMFHVVRTVEDCPPTIISAHRRILFELEAMDATSDYPSLGTHFPHLSTGISIIPSLGSMNTITMLQVESSGSMLRVFIFSDIMLIAKPKGKRKKDKSSMSKLVTGLNSMAGNEPKKEKFALFRMAWLRDVEVVDLANEMTTAKSGLGFSKNSAEKHLVKLVLHNSESATPTGRRRFWAELASANTSLAGADMSKKNAISLLSPVIDNTLKEKSEDVPSKIAATTPAITDAPTEVKESGMELPSVGSIERLALERLGLNADGTPVAPKTEVAEKSDIITPLQSSAKPGLHRSTTYHGAGRRSMTPRTTSLSGTNPSITALVENMSIDKAGPGQTGIIMTAPTGMVNNTKPGLSRRNSQRQSSFSSPTSSSLPADDSPLAVQQTQPLSTSASGVSTLSAAANNDSAPIAELAVDEPETLDTKTGRGRHVSAPIPPANLGSMASMISTYNEAKEKSQQNVAEGFIFEFHEKKHKNDLMLVVERLVSDKKMRPPGS